MIATLFVTFILLLACSFPIAVSQSFASMFLIFGDAPLSLESFTKAIMYGRTVRSRCTEQRRPEYQPGSRR